MSTTVDITEHLAQFTACGLIVVDGEPAKREHPILDVLTTGGYNLIEPRPLVAPELWRKLTEPCATCDDVGSFPFNHVELDRRCLNPDCDRGRQVVTLKATCEWCYGTGHYVDDRGEVYEDVCGDDGCDKGVVTLGRFTIRLLPIIGDDAEVLGSPTEEPPHHIYISPTCADIDTAFLYLGDAESDEPLDLDPLPQPGQWAVQFEAVPT